MRVAHFAQTFSPLSETFVYDSVRELGRRGVDNHVLTLNRVNAEVRPFEKAHIINAPHASHPVRLWHRALASVGVGQADWAVWPVLRSRIKRLLRRIAPDVLHAQFGPAGVLVAPVAHALKVPLVVTFHGYDATKLPKEARWRKAYRSLGNRATQLLGVSSHICEEMRASGLPEQKTKKFYLGVRLEEFEHDQVASSKVDSVVRCLHVGRLVEKKAPAKLVEAFSVARERIAEDTRLHLSIAGGGPLHDTVAQRIDELNLSAHVDLMGPVSHKRVKELLQSADIYTQHSITAADGDKEGLPVSLMEAAATGLPIISTRHSGIPDLVAHGETGLLVEERDVEGMGGCIANLATDANRRRSMGHAGREHVKENFDLKNQTRKLIQVYESVIA